MATIWKTFRTVLLSAFLWGVASVHTGTMGPLTTYTEAVSLACAGEVSEALGMFWTAVEMFLCLNDFMSVVGLLSVVAHCGSVFIFFCRAFLRT
jgi:hypothetical protein